MEMGWCGRAFVERSAKENCRGMELPPWRFKQALTRVGQMEVSAVG